MRTTISLSQREVRDIIVERIMDFVCEDHDATDDDRTNLDMVLSRDDVYLAKTLRKILNDAKQGKEAIRLDTDAGMSTVTPR